MTRQGFYAWKRRPASARELADRMLCERIRQIYTETEEIYGAPRIHSELKLADGIRVGKKRARMPSARQHFPSGRPVRSSGRAGHSLDRLLACL